MRPATEPHEGASSESRALSAREIRSARSREAIIDGIIRCLIKYGYADTTTTRIVAEAGVSRGALAHHFPVKEDAIVAASNKILAPAIRDLEPLSSDTLAEPDRDTAIVKADLRRLWRGLSNTPNSLALLEILIALRTDQALAARVQNGFEQWHAVIDQWIGHHYEHRAGDDDNLKALWGLVRVAFFGLLVYRPFVPNEQESEMLVDRLLDLVAPLIRRRTPKEQGGTK